MKEIKFHFLYSSSMIHYNGDDGDGQVLHSFNKEESIRAQSVSRNYKHVHEQKRIDFL